MKEHILKIAEKLKTLAEGDPDIDREIAWAILPSEHQKIFNGEKYYPSIWFVKEGQSYSPLKENNNIKQYCNSLDEKIPREYIVVVSEQKPHPDKPEETKWMALQKDSKVAYYGRTEILARRIAGLMNLYNNYEKIYGKESTDSSEAS